MRQFAPVDPILPLPDIEKPAAEDIYALDSANAGGVRILASSPEDLLRSPLFDKLEATESKNPSLSLCGGKDACKYFHKCKSPRASVFCSAQLPPWKELEATEAFRLIFTSLIVKDQVDLLSYNRDDCRIPRRVVVDFRFHFIILWME